MSFGASIFFLLLLIHMRKRFACSYMKRGLTMQNAAKSRYWTTCNTFTANLLRLLQVTCFNRRLKTSWWKQDSSLVTAAFLLSVVLSWEDSVKRWKPQISMSQQDR